MASEANVKSIIRRNKNVPTLSNAERLMLELHADNATHVRRSVLSEVLSLGGTGAATMTNAIPAGSRVLFVGYFLESAVTLTTAVKLAVGTASSPGAFYVSGTTMAAGTTDSQPVADANARVSTATNVRLSTTDTSGNATGSGTGSVKVVVVYESLQPLTA